MDSDLEPRPEPLPGPDLFRLDGKVALITGSGGEFGHAIALGLARAGASLLLTSQNGTKLQSVVDAVRAVGGMVASWPGDVAKPDDVDAVFAHLDAEFGRIDVLINNAGINPHQGRPEEFPLEVWQHVLTTNVTAYLLFAQRAARRMLRDGRGGSIVNVSSIAGARAMGRGNLAFGVSKAGVEQLTRELAVEWAPSGIRVNAIQPCQFLNEGLRGLVADPRATQLVGRMLAGIPMGRMGEPHEIVGPILFLASPAASMVTGVTLPVDGGNLALNPGGSVPSGAGSPWPGGA